MSPLEVVHCITRFRAKPRPLPAFSPSYSAPVRSAFTGRFSYLTSARDTTTNLVAVLRTDVRTSPGKWAVIRDE